MRSISEAIAPHCDRMGCQRVEAYVTRVKAQRRKSGVHGEKGTGRGTWPRWRAQGIDMDYGPASVFDQMRHAGS